MGESSQEAITKCPACGGTEITRSVYKLPYSSASWRLSQVLEKWQLNIVVDVKCNSCGYSYRE